jgi:hypothetical protein
MTQRTFDVALHGFGGHPEPGRDLSMCHGFETIEQKCLAAYGRQLLQRGSDALNTFGRLCLSLWIGARASDFGRSLFVYEELAGTRLAALMVRYQIGGGGEQHRPGLAPRQWITTLLEVEPGILKSVLRRRAAGSPRQEPKEIIADRQEATCQTIRRIHVEIRASGRKGPTVYHF